MPGANFGATLLFPLPAWYIINTANEECKVCCCETQWKSFDHFSDEVLELLGGTRYQSVVVSI